MDPKLKVASAAVALMVAGLGIVWGLAGTLGYGVLGVDASVDGVVVRYYRPLLGRQAFRVVVQNVSGQVYPTTLSLYAWMPNGSIVELGRYVGRGTIDVGLQAIIGIAREWRQHLVRHGNDPRLVRPGMIVLGAAHTPSGVYGVIKGIPLDIEKVLQGASVSASVGTIQKRRSE
jgi:hypothetical protein